MEEIIEKAHNFIKIYNWECDEDKVEFEASVNKLDENNKSFTHTN